MAIALLTAGTVSAAFCIWLTVRIVNRRERWAKRTLAAVVGLTVLYVLSFGPACWLPAPRPPPVESRHGRTANKTRRTNLLAKAPLSAILDYHYGAAARVLRRQFRTVVLDHMLAQ